MELPTVQEATQGYEAALDIAPTPGSADPPQALQLQGTVHGQD